MIPNAVPIPTDEIFALFRRVAGKVQWPKLKYVAPNGRDKIVFYVAGNKSKYKGDIMITDGKSYGQNKYYGRIAQSSGPNNTPMLFLARDARNEPDMDRTITEIVHNPTAYAKMQGIKYSYCCFCGTLIRNKNSLAVGYGPICADNYGLPWEGEGAAKARREELEQQSIDKGNM